ncbi:MAG: hypothetical protein PHP22_07665 [Oscillospiraceae bacterium]|nr:hypothetical protein [Oscillospiraceae bacterium]
MTSKIYALLVMIFSLAGVATASACAIMIQGLHPVLLGMIVFLLLLYFAAALMIEIDLLRYQKKDPWADVFGPLPISAEVKSQNKRDLVVLTFLGTGPVAILAFFLINLNTGLAALILFVVGCCLLAQHNKQRNKVISKSTHHDSAKYVATTPVDFPSYRFFEESLSKAAEIISASRVSGLPFAMPCEEKINRLAKDESCAILAFESGLDQILSGVQAVMTRRGFDASVITREAVIAGDSGQIQKRRRKGEDTSDNDLNCIGRILDGAGLVLLDLLYHPYEGHIITVITPAELDRLEELNYIDLDELRRCQINLA